MIRTSIRVLLYIVLYYYVCVEYPGSYYEYKLDRAYLYIPRGDQEVGAKLLYSMLSIYRTVPYIHHLPKHKQTLKPIQLHQKPHYTLSKAIIYIHILTPSLFIPLCEPIITVYPYPAVVTHTSFPYIPTTQPHATSNPHLFYHDSASHNNKETLPSFDLTHAGNSLQ